MGKNITYTCDYCSKSFTEEDLQTTAFNDELEIFVEVIPKLQTIRISLSDYMYVCNNCKEKYVDNCTECGKSIPKDSKKRPYCYNCYEEIKATCTKCRRVFFKKTMLHNTALYSRDKTYFCTDCCKHFVDTQGNSVLSVFKNEEK